MLLFEERKAVVEFGRKLIANNLTTGIGGNLSIFKRSVGLIAIKPSGVEYNIMRPEDVVVITPEGHIVDGGLQPSSEIRIHMALLNHRKDVNAVIHTHQVYATTIACMNWELPAVHYLVMYSGEKVPIAKYATFGTQELSDNIIKAIGSYNACLMANHGIVTVGEDIKSAFDSAEQLEFVSRLYYQCKCLGEPNILSSEDMKLVIEKPGGYGHSQKE